MGYLIWTNQKGNKKAWNHREINSRERLVQSGV